MGGQPHPPPAPYRPDLPAGRLRGADRPGRGAGGRLHRAALGVGPGPGPGDRPRRVGARQRRQLPATGRPPPRDGWTRPACVARQPADRAAGRPAGHGRPGGHRAPRWAWCSAGSRPGCSASTTCCSPRRPSRTRTSCTSSGPTWWPSSAARLRAPRVPAVAGPPRGDPPLPVHRHPLDARLLRLPGGGGHRLAGAGPVPLRRGPAPDDRRDPGRPQPAPRQRGPRAWWPRPSSSRGSTASRP